MHSLETIIARNAKAAGREGAHADSDGDDRLASAIHAAATEHGASAFCGVCVYPMIDHAGADHDFVVVAHDPTVDKPDLNDESYPWFATGYLDGRKDG